MLCVFIRMLLPYYTIHLEIHATVQTNTVYKCVSVVYTRPVRTSRQFSVGQNSIAPGAISRIIYYIYVRFFLSYFVARFCWCRRQSGPDEASTTSRQACVLSAMLLETVSYLFIDLLRRVDSARLEPRSGRWFAGIPSHWCCCWVLVFGARNLSANRFVRNQRDQRSRWQEHHHSPLRKEK